MLPQRTTDVTLTLFTDHIRRHLDVEQITHIVLVDAGLLDSNTVWTCTQMSTSPTNTVSSSSDLRRPTQAFSPSCEPQISDNTYLQSWNLRPGLTNLWHACRKWHTRFSWHATAATVPFFPTNIALCVCVCVWNTWRCSGFKIKWKNSSD
jgi:hypothetical protein